MDIDAVTLEIMRNRWRGIAEESCAAMIRTAYSPNIKDRFDCAAALALPDGQVFAQAELATPIHLGVMPAVIASILRKFPAETMRLGDAFITNLPYPEGAGHLPDLSMVSPVCHEGQVIALVATTAHHIDLGGYAPGSMPLGVTEIYQEGLQIPPTRLIHEGEMDRPIFDLIHQNVRTRREMYGDLMAQYAASCTAQQRVGDLLRCEGPHVVLGSIHPVLDHAERCMRAGIAKLADGTCTFEDFLDDDGLTDEPIRIRATIIIRGDELWVDFTGTSKQVLGPLNARLSAAKACVYYACKAVIDPDLPTCAGTYRAIHVSAPEGCVLQARFPAAIGNANILTDQRVVDALLGAFYQVAPERVCAACSGEMNLVNVGGIDPRSGEYYNYVETYAGGQGALFDQDGQDGIHTHLTNTRNTSAEVIERAYPLEVGCYGLIADSEGPGMHRGGCGVVRELVCLGERTLVSIGADRRKFQPWGLEGGRHARGSHCFVCSPAGAVRELPTKFFITLHKGDRLRIETPGGGGWGEPTQRPRDACAKDVRGSLIAPERASDIYGYFTVG